MQRFYQIASYIYIIIYTWAACSRPSGLAKPSERRLGVWGAAPDKSRPPPPERLEDGPGRSQDGPRRLHDSPSHRLDDSGRILGG